MEGAVDFQGSNISSWMDAAYYGFLISIVLFGISIVQAWTYFMHNSDKWGVRCMVATLMCLNIAKAWLNSDILHHYLIDHFGGIESLDMHSELFLVDFVITGVVLFLVNLYFASRIHLLSGNRTIIALIVLMDTTLLISSIYAISQQSKGFEARPVASQATTIEVTIFHVIATMTDLLVTFSLWRILSNSKQETIFRRTRKALDRIMAFLLTRGILMTILQVVHLIMYAVKPNDILFWNGSGLPLSYMCVITVLSMLNQRPLLSSSIDGNMELIGSLNFAHSITPTDVVQNS